MTPDRPDPPGQVVVRDETVKVASGPSLQGARGGGGARAGQGDEAGQRRGAGGERGAARLQPQQRRDLPGGAGKALSITGPVATNLEKRADLGLGAEQSRGGQRTRFQPAHLIVRGVFDQATLPTQQAYGAVRSGGLASHLENGGGRPALKDGLAKEAERSREKEENQLDQATLSTQQAYDTVRSGGLASYPEDNLVPALPAPASSSCPSA